MKKKGNKIKPLIVKYKDLILYLVFGALTTIINMAVYYLTYNIIKMPNVPSTIVAWVASVIFAYITNKIWVFESKSFKIKTIMREAVSFFGCRLATGGLDVLIMFLAVDMMKWNGTLWKLISNIIVIIINYLASKFLIFNKTKKRMENGRKNNG